MLIKKKMIIGTFWETKNEKERKRERVRDREGKEGEEEACNTASTKSLLKLHPYPHQIDLMTSQA